MPISKLEVCKLKPSYWKIWENCKHSHYYNFKVFMYCWGAKQTKYSQLFPFHSIHALSWNFGSLLKTHTSLSKPDIFGKLEKSPVIHPGNFKAVIHYRVYNSRGLKTENQIFAKRHSECRKIWEKYYWPSHYSHFKAFMHWQVWEFGMGKVPEIPSVQTKPWT